MLHTSAGTVRVYTFGNYRFIPSHGMLFDGAVAVAAGSRALAILTMLVERPGEIISKTELMAQVWPGIFVDETNLRVHIAALRRLLGDGSRMARLIANVPGRGYRFLPHVSVADLPAEAVAIPVETPADRDYPRLGKRLVGRAETVSMLAGELAKRRFVTVTGAGGIGKTSVALAVADASLQAYPDGVRFVDYAAVEEPKAAGEALAFAIGLSAGNDPFQAAIVLLKQKRMLLILDNCEHLREAVGTLASAIFAAAPQTGVLVTSREPLRVEGERVHKLPPLALPDASADEALSSFSSIELFIERANERAQIEETDLPLIARICRCLDGIPLAIELAAGQVETFGVKGLAALLEEKFALVMRDRHRSLTRHRTMVETLDWSYRLLPEREQELFRQLAIFAGKFETADVRAVTLCPHGDVMDDLAALIDKSLVCVEIGDDAVSYRLLETTRVYAREKLEAHKAYREIARRHAEHYSVVLAKLLGSRDGLTPGQWNRAHHSVLENLHAALEWALAEDGAEKLGVSLCLQALPLWNRLSLLSECRRFVEMALRWVGREDREDARTRMLLLEALGRAVPITVGGGHDVAAWWNEAYAIAAGLDDHEHKLQTLFGLWATQCYSAEYRQALDTATRFREQSRPGQDMCIADRMAGTALHILGEQDEAFTYIARMLAHYVVPSDNSGIMRFMLEQKLQGQSTYAGIQWLRGFADQSWEAARKCVETALAEPHAISICNVLAHSACPLALYMGDLEAASRYTAMLLEQSSVNGLEVWQHWALAFDALVALHKNFSAAGFQRFEQALEALPASSVHPRYKVLRWSYAWALGRVGLGEKGLRLIDGLLADLHGNGEMWCVPEALRTKAEILLGFGASLEAEAVLEEALSLARCQNALGWELKAALSLARLLLGQGRRGEAQSVLAERYRLHTEGWETGDMRDATALLSMLS